METDLKGRNVLVTEVGNPLGRSTALAFAREGANLVLGTLHDSDALIAAHHETARLGVKVIAASYEVAREDGIKQFVQRGLDELGHIDVLLNNMAWPAARQSFAGTSFATWKGAIHLGLTGSLFMCREDIAAARESADVVVVSWHWGISPYSGGKGELVGYQTEMAHLAVDAGADLIVGHHPHLVQPIEVYKGKAIFYSLANFVHDGPSFWTKKQDTILARCRIRNRKVNEVCFVPGRINEQNQPVPLKPAEAPELLRHIREVSAAFGTDFQVREEEVAVVTETAIR